MATHSWLSDDDAEDIIAARTRGGCCCCPPCALPFEFACVAPTRARQRRARLRQQGRRKAARFQIAMLAVTLRRGARLIDDQDGGGRRHYLRG
jgi:hypothetical protein